MKRGVIFIFILIVAGSIAFFSFFWPLNNAESAAGTLGGIEKAEKYRGDQLVSRDVLLENQAFANLTQSAEWQNAMKNEEFVAFLKSDEFQKSLLFQHDLQNVVLARACFEAVKNSDFKSLKTSEETMKSVLSNDFQSGICFFSQEFHRFAVHSQDPDNLSFTDAMKFLYSNNEVNSFGLSSDMQNLIHSQELSKMLDSPHFQLVNTIFGSWAQNFQGWLSQNMQAIITIHARGAQKNAVAFNQDMQQSIGAFSQDFQNIFMSQEMQQAMYALGNDMQQAIWVSQDYQKFYCTSEMQSLYSVLFNSFMESDFQNSLLPAFDDYMKMW